MYGYQFGWITVLYGLSLETLEQTRKAFEELEMENGVLLIDKVREKKKKRMEDFEEEEEFYYKHVEKELLEKLYQYVMENKTRFR